MKKIIKLTCLVLMCACLTGCPRGHGGGHIHFFRHFISLPTHCQ
jgi:hypothetical protein